jgi:thioredoxin 1
VTTLRAVGDADFGDVVLGAVAPVLVQFGAAASAPCREVGAVLEELAAELPGLAFTRLDVGAHPVTASAYGVTGLPTLLLFLEGRSVLSVVGARPKSVLRELLLAALAGQVR